MRHPELIDPQGGVSAGSRPAGARAHPALGWRKRAFDVLVASVALLALSPALVMIAIAVRATSAGPAIFRQRRTGLQGRVFTLYKFRSMSVQEDGANVRQARAGDPRVTRFGRVLRATSLDELPQLLNVIAGDMALVGPRPHALAHDDYYARRIPDYVRRQSVRPGLTGLAQVTGWRGETDTLDKMEGRVGADLAYVDAWSFGLDLKIAWRTVGVVLGRRQAW